MIELFNLLPYINLLNYLVIKDEKTVKKKKRKKKDDHHNFQSNITFRLLDKTVQQSKTQKY